jgi:hypothetical protein
MVKKGFVDDKDEDDEWEPVEPVHVTAIQGTEDLLVKSKFKKATWCSGGG